MDDKETVVCLNSYFHFVTQFHNFLVFMNLQSIVSWNVRGAASDLNKFNIRSVAFEARASMLCVQEKKKLGHWA